MKENYQEKAKELFGNSCYLYCLAYLAGLRQFKEMTKQILEWWYAGYCDDNGFVISPHKCIGAKDVKIVPYKPSSNYQIVCWEYNKGTHFVVMRDNKVVFDPSGESNTVKFGKIKNAREFI